MKAYKNLLNKVAPALTVCSLLTTGTAATLKADVLADKADRIVASQHDGMASVIVRMDGGLTSQRESQLKSLKADIYRRLPIIESAAVRIPSRNLTKLAALTF